MNIIRAMDLVDVWRKDWPSDPANQTPQQMAMLSLFVELRVTRMSELHERVAVAELEAKKLQTILDEIANALP